jgi:hypothetical protein
VQRQDQQPIRIRYSQPENCANCGQLIVATERGDGDPRWVHLNNSLNPDCYAASFQSRPDGGNWPERGGDSWDERLDRQWTARPAQGVTPNWVGPPLSRMVSVHLTTDWDEREEARRSGCLLCHRPCLGSKPWTVLITTDGETEPAYACGSRHMLDTVADFADQELATHWQVS